MKYYFARDNRPQGPYSLDELRQFALTPDTLIWIPGNPDWKEARNFPEVMEVISGGAVPPPFYPARYNQQTSGPRIYRPIDNYRPEEYGADGRYQPLRPDNYLAEAIVVTILCCNPLGIISIVYGSRVNRLYDERRFDEARQASANARNWFVATLISGIISWLWFIFI